MRLHSCWAGEVAEATIVGMISVPAPQRYSESQPDGPADGNRYGMSENIGPVTFGGKYEEIFLGEDWGTYRNYSEKVASLIDKETKLIVQEAYERAERLLKENINKLHKVAETLLEKEKLDMEEFEQVFASA